MRPSFFIFSLPRSGSSWLSVFLTGPDSFCYHEPTADHSPIEWKSLATKRKGITGAVDTGAYCFANEIWDALPNTNFYSLCRDPHEINRSSRWNHIDYDAYKEREKLDSLKHERIIYSKLSDISYLEEIWARIIGTEFDEERTKLLIDMRIERDISKFFSDRPELCFMEALH
jgi:hypothetical protein